tara:strand:- start:126 stop:308 length:183 start_codon:yes stop_codon:yes gene_type:complete
MAFQETLRHELSEEDSDPGDITPEFQGGTESDIIIDFKNKKRDYSDLEDELSIEEDFMAD